MKYMFVTRATDEAVEASKEVPFEEIVNRMGAYNESLIDAGVLLGGEGLAEVSEDNAFVVDFSEDPPLVTDGPYGETHELFNGFRIVQVASCTVPPPGSPPWPGARRSTRGGGPSVSRSATAPSPTG